MNCELQQSSNLLLGKADYLQIREELNLCTRACKKRKLASRQTDRQARVLVPILLYLIYLIYWFLLSKRHLKEKSRLSISSITYLVLELSLQTDRLHWLKRKRKERARVSLVSSQERATVYSTVCSFGSPQFLQFCYPVIKVIRAKFLSLKTLVSPAMILVQIMKLRKFKETHCMRYFYHTRNFPLQ